MKKTTKKKTEEIKLLLDLGFKVFLDNIYSGKYGTKNRADMILRVENLKEFVDKKFAKKKDLN